MDRIPASLLNKVITAEEAAGMVEPNSVIVVSGFGIAGDPYVIPSAIAKLGKATNLTIFSGASIGNPCDGELTEAGLIARRYPYQTNKTLRKAINEGKVAYADQHLSHLPKYLMEGLGPEIDFAIIECTAVTEEGLYVGPSVGISNVGVKLAKKVLVEINTNNPMEYVGMHDVYSTAGTGEVLPLTGVMDRIGTPYIPCPPDKIAGIVVTDIPKAPSKFRAPDQESQTIANYIVDFLKDEIKAGRQPANLHPLQSGVGNVANAVLAGLETSGFKGIDMYSEVIQDSALKLIKKGVVAGVSGAVLMLSEECQEEMINNIDFYKERIVIRSQEISNNPELARRMSVIAMNTPIEVDIYGNVNSTHIMGTKIMNGIGGSADFARNAGTVIFATSSIAKDGDISCIVPMVSHVDSTEHEVMVIVTEQGIADLRWKSPRERAEAIIENCAHPDYKDMLWDYYHRACALGGQTPHILSEALSWHDRFNKTGTMKLS